MTAEELESKRKARMERFGAQEVKESQEAAQFKLNRRKQKIMRKGGGGTGVEGKTLDALAGGRKHKNNKSFRGHQGKGNNKHNKGQKRFKKGGNRD